MDDHERIERGTADATDMDDESLGARRVTRRTFLRTTALGLAAGGPAVHRVVHGAAAQPIGVQMYTLRDIADGNFEFALRIASEAGYREVEFAGMFDNKLSNVVKWLGKYRLTAPATHISLDRLKANLKGVVDEAQQLGVRYVVCPGVDAGQRRDADGWRRVAADFNRVADALQRVGLRFAYHNHEYEFMPLPTGELGYDILLAECDPKLVKMELDLFWITKGGRDPLTYFARWPGRFPLVHVKDMAGNGVMTNVGQGHIDWPRIFAKRREAGIEHFFVEHDNPKSPADDIAVSYRYMAKLDL